MFEITTKPFGILTEMSDILAKIFEMLTKIYELLTDIFHDWNLRDFCWNLHISIKSSWICSKYLRFGVKSYTFWPHASKCWLKSLKFLRKYLKYWPKSLRFQAYYLRFRPKSLRFRPIFEISTKSLSFPPKSWPKPKTFWPNLLDAEQNLSDLWDFQ